MQQSAIFRYPDNLSFNDLTFKCRTQATQIDVLKGELYRLQSSGAAPIDLKNTIGFLKAKLSELQEKYRASRKMINGLRDQVVDAANNQKVTTEQKAQIARQEAQIAHQKAALDSQKALLMKQHLNIGSQTGTLVDQHAVITEQKATLVSQYAVVTDQKAMIANQQAALDKQKLLLEQKCATIADQKAANAELLEAHMSQKVVITEQQATLTSQEGRLSRQEATIQELLLEVAAQHQTVTDQTSLNAALASLDATRADYQALEVYNAHLVDDSIAHRKLNYDMEQQILILKQQTAVMHRELEAHKSIRFPKTTVVTVEAPILRVEEVPRLAAEVMPIRKRKPAHFDKEVEEHAKNAVEEHAVEDLTELKRCSLKTTTGGCKKLLPLDDFYKGSNICISCAKKRSKRRRRR